MKFCNDCKKLYADTDSVCTSCNKNLKEIKDINEPIMLCVVGGVERGALCGALRDAQIPFVERQHGRMGVSNELVTGYDAKLLNLEILVPYSALPKAYDIAKQLELCDDGMDSVIEQVKADVEKYKETMKADEAAPMSRKKRTTVKVLSALLFIIILALAIFGTDYVMELIKNLLGG
ncbi:MAG: hypothetical protein IIX27_04260 [Ruminococcus sp.]|nr:hypothetical protein [Ruminococcus sp.]